MQCMYAMYVFNLDDEQISFSVHEDDDSEDLRKTIELQLATSVSVSSDPHCADDVIFTSECIFRHIRIL